MKRLPYQLALLALIFSVLILAADAATNSKAASAPQTASTPSVALQAGSGATITFKTQNGATIDNNPAQTFDLPHLVLYRNDVLTDPSERTLTVEVSGIQVPPAGVTVTLKLKTQHGDPNLGGVPEHRIPVWRASQQIANTTSITQTGATVTFAKEFTATVMSDGATIATPTDYYGYEITVVGAQKLASGPLHTFSQDHALLVENQWIARLPQVREASQGAAPDELVVYSCDMFPYRAGNASDTPWLRREDVADFVESELVPAMVEAFRVETDEWGFTWYPAWTSFRSGEDSERLSVALTREGVWYHGRAPYPSLGHAEISLRVDAQAIAAYDTLADALLSTFYHELFHHLQRNVQQHSGGAGDIDGAGNVWQFFSEGTAVLAASVGKPDAEFAPAPAERNYTNHANWFLGRDYIRGDLNRSFAELNPYHAAIYWRFLYERCGAVRDAVQDPAAGMDIIRRTLTVLYSGEVVDINTSTDLVSALPQVMDGALSGAECPFETYEGSLAAFSKAIYGLRLEGGRCTQLSKPAGCGLYDPNDLYKAPNAGVITYDGGRMVYDATAQRFPSGIPSSYGMDFVDVSLDPSINGQSVALEFYGTQGAAAAFSVQVWQLTDAGSDGNARQVTAYTPSAELRTERAENGRLVLVISNVDTSVSNRLGLIITRVDSSEELDPIGAYTVALRPVANGEANSTIR